jgi:hypothetical protein
MQAANSSSASPSPAASSPSTVVDVASNDATASVVGVPVQADTTTANPTTTISRALNVSRFRISLIAKTRTDTIDNDDPDHVGTWAPHDPSQGGARLLWPSTLRL